MEWLSVFVRGRRDPSNLLKPYLMETAGCSRERQGGDHLRVGKVHQLSIELLDWELGPCAGIPSRGAPMKISGKR